MCSDDKAVLISIQNEREWKQLCADFLGDDGIATDERFDSNNMRVANRDALEHIVAGVFGSAPRETIIERLTAAGIAFGRLTDLEDLTAHPQNRFITVQSDGGEIELMAPGPVTRGAAADYGPVPSLGQHDAALRAEFG
jgi:crotonobetainyl-CoA:carnitine CoA-transferase CaiB-like acyl-CoA transferase